MIDKICVIGLGYIGLPLAHAFASKYEVVGFNIHQTRIDELNSAHNRTMLRLIDTSKLHHLGWKYKIELEERIKIMHKWYLNL